MPPLGWIYRRVLVEGHSMLPTFVPGERVSCLRRWRPVRKGDVVVVKDPSQPGRLLLKRCVDRAGSMIELRGDNAEVSIDSRGFGWVPARDAAWFALGSERRRNRRRPET